MGGFSQAVKKMVGLRTGRIAKTWGYDTRAPLLVPPIVADINKDGKHEIVIATSKGDLIVLDQEAKELWRYCVHEKIGAVEEMFLDQDVMNSINAAPGIGDVTGDGNLNIVFGSEMGVLYCLDEQGKEVWKCKTEGGIRGSPLIADVNGDGKQEIIFGGTDKFLYILSQTGEVLERFEQASPIESTPGYFNGQIIFGTNDGTIISITAKGEENWSHKTGAQVIAPPTFTKLIDGGPDYVIIGSTDNSVYCIDTDGELAWTYRTSGAIYGQAAVADLNGDGKREVVIGSCDNNVHAITHEGERFWTYETDFWIVSSPIITDIDGDGKLEVIAGSYDHNIYVLDSEGTYILDYVPGLAGVVQQPGHYSDIMTQEPGQHVGKKLWQFKTEGVVMGCAQAEKTKGIIVTTKKGLVDELVHQT